MDRVGVERRNARRRCRSAMERAARDVAKASGIAAALDGHREKASDVLTAIVAARDAIDRALRCIMPHAHHGAVESLHRLEHAHAHLTMRYLERGIEVTDG